MDAKSFSPPPPIDAPAKLTPETIAIPADRRRGDQPYEGPDRRGRSNQYCGKYSQSIPGALDLQELANPQLTAELAAKAQGVNTRIKRALDIVLALSLLIAFAPVGLLVAIAIKLESKGPVLFRQTRVGLGGRTFDVIKFRSMRVDAERDGPQWAVKKDPRATKVGDVIRRLHIDEVPQAVNILRGDMSFIGPRPERPEFVRTLENNVPSYRARLLVKPGLTGWAQVSYRYCETLEDAWLKLRYDLYYIRNFSVWTEVKILFNTVRVVIFGLRI